MGMLNADENIMTRIGIAMGGYHWVDPHRAHPSVWSEPAFSAMGSLLLRTSPGESTAPLDRQFDSFSRTFMASPCLGCRSRAEGRIHTSFRCLWGSVTFRCNQLTMTTAIMVTLMATTGVTAGRTPDATCDPSPGKRSNLPGTSRVQVINSRGGLGLTDSARSGNLSWPSRQHSRPPSLAQTLRREAAGPPRAD